MKLSELLARLEPTGLDRVPFPRHLLGAFRRKSITFADGLTDETTVVYWFQSRSFTIDLRLPDAAATPVTHRQGWIGDTIWDEQGQQLSWQVAASYQPRNQWPEPARLHFIGNSVIEFAPSGAYVEDWRQQSCAGPLLGLRLVGVLDGERGREHAVDGGLVLAGNHAAYAQSRGPRLDRDWGKYGDLDRALSDAKVTEGEIESYEVSVAACGNTITHSTRAVRCGQAIASGDFEIASDGTILMSPDENETMTRRRFVLDLYVPDFAFGHQTPSTSDARDWLEREKAHLAKHAVSVR